MRGFLGQPTHLCPVLPAPPSSRPPSWGPCLSLGVCTGSAYIVSTFLYSAFEQSSAHFYMLHPDALAIYQSGSFVNQLMDISSHRKLCSLPATSSDSIVAPSLSAGCVYAISRMSYYTSLCFFNKN